MSRDMGLGSLHLAALRFAEMGTFMAALRTQPGVAARALEFLILTATRTSEVIGARWSEIDMEAAVWNIPAERMKAHRAHRVPLSPQAVKLLRSMEALRRGDLVFRGRAKASRSRIWQCSYCWSAWNATISPCTGSARHFAIGHRNARTTREKCAKWRSRTP